MKMKIFYKSVLLFFIGIGICFILSRFLSSNIALISTIIIISVTGSKFIKRT